MSMDSHPEVGVATRELATMGRELGGLRWVQGPGGNCSVKVGSELWVKASGLRLTQLAAPKGHARVGLEAALRALGGDEAAEKVVFAVRPRPSLETYFHAFGPRVVAHTHCLGALLAACSTEAVPSDVLGDARRVPYFRPGRPLAEAAKAELNHRSETAEHVLLLASHGVLVYAESAERAVHLTKELDEAIAKWAGQDAAVASFEKLAAIYASTPPAVVAGGVYRVLPDRRGRSGEARYLFPDAAVCATAVVANAWADERAVAVQALAELPRSCVVGDSGGRRLAVAKSSLQLEYACEVAAAHDWLEDVLLERGTPNYLPAEEIAALLDLPSEQYRLRLSASS